MVGFTVAVVIVWDTRSWTMVVVAMSVTMSVVVAGAGVFLIITARAVTEVEGHAGTHHIGIRAGFQADCGWHFGAFGQLA